jgi:signal transduction histidine kinase
LLAELAVPLTALALVGEVPASLMAVAETLMAPWIAVAIGVAILRHRLYDIDRIINRTLVYGGLTAAVVLVYVLVVGYFGAMLDVRGEPVSLLAAAVVAVLFAPLRERLQMLSNRLVYGRREEPYTVLTELGRRLERSREHHLDPEAVLATLVDTVREALKLRHAEIQLAGSRGQASTGEPTGTPRRLPLAFGGEPVGELLVSPRGPEETFSAADRRLLDDFARQAAVAAHAVILTSDVQRARTRVVTAREEERRRIRRDLHDGLGPQLASQTLALDAARALIGSDPTAADELLVELREQTREAVSGIRRLVYDLRPPVLDDRGLPAALCEQVPRFTREGLEVHTDIDPDLPPLPAALDVAAYRIALEALTNVVRHAGATRCELRLAVDDGQLVVEVTDDGVGIPSEAPSGVGLASMRERAAELGGNVAIRCRPEGGTALQASLPMAVGD